VLVVHSNAADEALERLDAVDEPESPVRAIVSVGMLKEVGREERLRDRQPPLVSVGDPTEQTLGRGLRLPFGAYSGIELLDTLEVVAHELETRTARAEATAAGQVELRPRADLPALVLPRLTTERASPSSRWRTSRSASTGTRSASSVSGSR